MARAAPLYSNPEGNRIHKPQTSIESFYDNAMARTKYHRRAVIYQNRAAVAAAEYPLPGDNPARAHFVPDAAGEWHPRYHDDL